MNFTTAEELIAGEALCVVPQLSVIGIQSGSRIQADEHMPFILRIALQPAPQHWAAKENIRRNLDGPAVRNVPIISDI